jgi:hypothetical protein
MPQLMVTVEIAIRRPVPGGEAASFAFARLQGKLWFDGQQAWELPAVYAWRPITTPPPLPEERP